MGDGEYGKAAAFRHGLSVRGLPRALGIAPNQKVDPAEVMLTWPTPKPNGQPRKHPVPSAKSVGAAALFAAMAGHAFRALSWGRGTKGKLAARFAAVRVRVADGPPQRIGDEGAQPRPGEEVWLVGEHRPSGERKHYLVNLPAGTPLKQLAGTLKARPWPGLAGRGRCARWVGEQAHQQRKEELGLDHREGRSGAALPTAGAGAPRPADDDGARLPPALRLREKSRHRPDRRRRAAVAEPTRRPTPDRSGVQHGRAALPALPPPHRVAPAALNMAE
jgi:hypothetical protein